MPLHHLCSLVSIFLILRMPHSVHYPIPDTPTHLFLRAGSILGQNRCRSPHALSSLRCATLVETPYRQPQHCLVISPVLSAADSSYHLMVPFLSFCSLAGGWCPLHVATAPLSFGVSPGPWGNHPSAICSIHRGLPMSIQAPIAHGGRPWLPAGLIRT